MRRFNPHLAVAVFSLAFLAGCTEPPPPPLAAAEHLAITEAWHEKRLAGLEQPIGWLSLAGLFWLDQAVSTFGADSSSTFVYDPPGRELAGVTGTFELSDGSVVFEPAAGADVSLDSGVVASRVVMEPDEPFTVLRSGALEWRIIRRGDRLAVRLWDTLSTVRTAFPGIERFTVDPAWRFPARFIVHDPPDTIDVPNILGTIGRTPSPGSVEFRYEGRKYVLMTWKDSDDPANFFTAFGDRTNGGLTYGGGRFLWIDAPDENGWTVVDFNRSYNPPCVFTDYATCPLPPRQNRLPFAIEAGERTYTAGH